MNEDVLEETSLELAIPKHLVKEVVAAQSEFTAETIRQGGMDGVMWPLFGKVRVKVSKVHYIHDMVGIKGMVGIGGIKTEPKPKKK